MSEKKATTSAPDRSLARERAQDTRAELLREQQARQLAEEEQRRLAFLAEASELLGTSLDQETILRSLMRLLVPARADWCVLDLVHEDGRIERVGVSHADPGKQHLAEALSRYPPDTAKPEGPSKVLRTGHTEYVAEVPDQELVGAAQDEHHLQVLRQLGVRSAVMVPLASHGRTRGVLSLVMSGSGRSYTLADVVLFESLAARLAITIENASLHWNLHETLRSRDEFLASVSHDLKNPITAITGYAQYVRRQLGADALRQDVKDALRHIEQNARKMAQALDELAEIAHTQDQVGEDLQPTDLVKLARQVVEQQQQATDQHRLLLRVDESELTGNWNAGQIERVLQNLIGNAIKFSPRGGEVVVELASEEPGEAANAGPVRYARAVVRDRGIGIPADDLERVLKQFHRAANARGIIGTGIGLVSTRRIVERHGGSIQIESQEGKGTTVTVRLPM